MHEHHVANLVVVWCKGTVVSIQEASKEILTNTAKEVIKLYGVLQASRRDQRVYRQRVLLLLVLLKIEKLRLGEVKTVR